MQSTPEEVNFYVLHIRYFWALKLVIFVIFFSYVRTVCQIVIKKSFALTYFSEVKKNRQKIFSF
jgi:hypothetical protein